jgi:AraC-like DNA-binding protein
MGMLIKGRDGEWHTLGELFSLGKPDGNLPLVREQRDKISFSFGDMERVLISLPDIYIVYGDMSLQQPDFHIRSLDGGDVVELNFVLTGNGIVDNRASGNKYIFTPNQHNMMFIPAFDGHATYQENARYKFFEVHFTRAYFLDLVKDACRVLNVFAEKIDTMQEAMASAQSLPMTLAMHRCIREIMDCRFSGGLKLLFLQSKCIELLTLQAEAFEKSRTAKTMLPSSRDKDCIVYAKEYLLEHITDPPTLDELAAIAGTNTFKLKNGFKELFSNTVFGYLNEVRLDQARILLQEGVPIKEVADRTGYSSVQHFSTSFRKKFNITPGKLKQA